jgi:hypothetical protein
MHVFRIDHRAEFLVNNFTNAARVFIFSGKYIRPVKDICNCIARGSVEILERPVCHLVFLQMAYPAFGEWKGSNVSSNLRRRGPVLEEFPTTEGFGGAFADTTHANNVQESAILQG